MTTILSVRRNGKVVVGGDGQVSLGNTILKGNARKVRKLNNGTVISGFAGSTADAFTLLDIFEQQIKTCNGNLEKAVIAFCKLWRTDKANEAKSFLISGAGDVITQEDDLLAIGSGGNYAYSAAKALLENTDLDAEAIVRKSLQIASDICVFTNNNFIIESL